MAIIGHLPPLIDSLSVWGVRSNPIGRASEEAISSSLVYKEYADDSASWEDLGNQG